MRMLTAQHLVSGLVYEMYDGARTVGNQIHADRSRIDFNPVKFDEGMIEELFCKANEMVKSNLEVTDCIMTRKEINGIMPPERTNMDLLPISVKELRIIKIGDNVEIIENNDPFTSIDIHTLEELQLAQCALEIRIDKKFNN